MSFNENVLALCEQDHLILRPDVYYHFEVIHDCKSCARLVDEFSPLYADRVEVHHLCEQTVMHFLPGTTYLLKDVEDCDACHHLNVYLTLDRRTGRAPYAAGMSE